MNRGLTTDTYSVIVSRLRAQPHRRALPLPLQGSDLQRLRERRRATPTRAARSSAWTTSRNGVVTRGVLIDIPRLKKSALSRAGHAGLRRRHRSVGEEGEGEGSARATPSSCARAAGRAARSSVRGTSARTRPAITRRSRRGSRSAGCRSSRSDDAQDVTPSLVDRHQPAGSHARHHGARHRHPRQSGSRSRCRNRGAAQSVGVPADRRAGSGDGRHGLPGQRARDFLNA